MEFDEDDYFDDVGAQEAMDEVDIDSPPRSPAPRPKANLSAQFDPLAEDQPPLSPSHHIDADQFRSRSPSPTAPTAPTAPSAAAALQNPLLAGGFSAPRAPFRAVQQSAALQEAQLWNAYADFREQDDQHAINEFEQLSQFDEPVSEPPSKIARPSPPAAAPRVAAVAPLPTASVGPALPRLFKMPPRDVANVRVTLLSNEGSGARVYAARSNPKVYDAEVTEVMRSFNRTSARYGGKKHLLSRPIEDILDELEEQRNEQARLAAIAKRDAKVAQEAEEQRRWQQMTEQPAYEDEDGNQIDMDQPEAELEPEVAPQSEVERKPKKQQRLWVNKYAPKRFVDLLSDDQVNRDVAAWLMAWDPVVFPERAQARAAAASTQARRPTGPTAIPRPAFVPYGQFNPTADVEDKTRPFNKILLLAGPPGSGKTTLAHIAALHCGYRPLEINASDDRSAEVLSKKILDGVEMQSLMGDHRPNCIILDEIDGALASNEKGGVNALVKMIQDSDRAYAAALRRKQQRRAGGIKRGGKDDDEGGNSKAGPDGSDDESDGENKPPKKVAPAFSSPLASKEGTNGALVMQKSRGGAKHAIINRPIICICNDLYAPALRPLRAIAQVHQFGRVGSQVLADRLQGICRKEKLAADPRALVALCELADNDVRSCLNTLQFLQSRSKAEQRKPGADQSKPSFNLEALSSLNIGSKDFGKDMFDIWRNVFQQPRSRRTALQSSVLTERMRQRNLSSAPAITSAAADSIDHADKIVSGFGGIGDPMRALQGVFENFPAVKYHDPTVEKTCEILDWLLVADQWSSGHGSSDAMWAMMGYIPFAALAIHQRVAQPNANLKLQLPKKDFELRTTVSKNEAIAQTLMAPTEGGPPSFYARHSIGMRRLAVEVLASLLVILSPKMRPANAFMLNESEKADIHRLVTAMQGAGLSYRMERSFGVGRDGSQQGMMIYLLDPPIQQLSQYTNFPHHDLSPKLKQLVAQEMNAEKLRRQHAALAASAPASSQATAIEHHWAKPADAPAAPAAPGLATTQQRNRLSSSSMSKAANAGTQGSGAGASADLDMSQARPQTFISNQRGKKRNERVRYPIHFSYQEGYTNAVRRPVRVKDLLSSKV